MEKTKVNSYFFESFRWHPYRILFPVGCLAGIFGVGHWVLWSVGISVREIKVLHMTFQSQGFLLFFVVGFLVTAFPRFTGSPPLRFRDLSLISIGAIGVLVSGFFRSWKILNISSLTLLIVFSVFIVRCVLKRTKEIPPSFSLIGFALVHSFLGIVFSLYSNMGDSNYYLYFVGRQMLHQGFILCAILGITAKLAPFLMGFTEGSENLKYEKYFHIFVGLIFLISFFMEPFFSKISLAVRALLVTFHFFIFSRIYRVPKKKTITISFFWISMWFILLGLWLMFFLPSHRIAWLHMVFIGGCSLMIFSFGMLVVLSHSGKAALLNGKLRVLKIVGFSIFIAITFRVSADLFPKYYMSFLHVASGFWVLGGVVWLIYAVLQMCRGYRLLKIS